MRYTHYDEHKKRWQINTDYGAVMIDELNYAVGEAVDNFAAYEDMELTPEEFHESVAFVLELNKKLKPYMDAEKNGLLVRLPCKVGDTLFVPSQETILNGTVDEISVYRTIYRALILWRKHES